MKRFFKCFFVLLVCVNLCGVSVYAQDSTAAKKPEQPKTEPAKSATVKTSAVKPPAKKPVFHAVRKAPVTTPVSVPAQTMDTAQANALKAQMDPNQLNDKTLNGQYQYLLTKVYHYQQPLIAALWKNAMDTLGQARVHLKDAQSKLGSLGKLVDSLKTTSKSERQSLAASNQKVDAISMFGIEMSKSNYNVFMFCLVGGLAAALIIVIITTAKHKHDAKYRTELYEEIEEEYKTFKAKAHEKELKLARELQTERNRLDDLLGKS